MVPDLTLATETHAGLAAYAYRCVPNHFLSFKRGLLSIIPTFDTPILDPLDFRVRGFTLSKKLRFQPPPDLTSLPPPSQDPQSTMGKAKKSVPADDDDAIFAQRAIELKGTWVDDRRKRFRDDTIPQPSDGALLRAHCVTVLEISYVTYRD